VDSVEHVTRNLPSRGWTPPEIDKASEILRQAPARKSEFIKVLDAALYWILLAVAILANFIVSIVLVPFLLVLTGGLLYGALFFLGLVFGTMLDVVVRETEFLQRQRYVMAEILIPAVALINIYMITKLSNSLATKLALPGSENRPVVVALVYVVAFILPHFAYGLLRRKKTSSLAAAA